MSDLPIYTRFQLALLMDKTDPKFGVAYLDHLRCTHSRLWRDGKHYEPIGQGKT